MNVVWHTDDHATRRFMVIQLGAAVVEAALSVLLAAILGWWLVVPSLAVLKLACHRVRERDIPVTELLLRERSHFLSMAFPHMSRIWSLACLAGAPIRLLRIVLLGFDPSELVAPFELHIDGPLIFIAPASTPPPSQRALDFFDELHRAREDDEP